MAIYTRPQCSRARLDLLLMLTGALGGGITVGEVESQHSDQLRAFVEELCAAGEVRLGVKLPPGVFDRLAAYRNRSRTSRRRSRSSSGAMAGLRDHGGGGRGGAARSDAAAHGGAKVAGRGFVSACHEYSLYGEPFVARCNSVAFESFTPTKDLIVEISLPRLKSGPIPIRFLFFLSYLRALDGGGHSSQSGKLLGSRSCAVAFTRSSCSPSRGIKVSTMSASAIPGRTAYCIVARQLRMLACSFATRRGSRLRK